jgi:hypothetical protein
MHLIRLSKSVNSIRVNHIENKCKRIGYRRLHRDTNTYNYFYLGSDRVRIVSVMDNICVDIHVT